MSNGKITFTLAHVKPYVGRTAVYGACVVLSVAFTIATALSVSDFLKILFHDPGVAESISTTGVGSVMGGWLNSLYTWLLGFGHRKALIYFSLLLLAVYSLKNVFGYLAAVQAGTMRCLILRDVRDQMHGKMLRLPVGYFVQHSKGEMLSRFSSDISEYEENILISLQTLVTAVASIVLYLTMLFYMDVRLTLFTLVTFPIVAFVISRISRRLKRQSKVLQEKNDHIMSLIEETMTGLKIVKAYNAIDFSNRRFQDVTADYRKLRTHLYRNSYLASPISDTMGNIIVICILLFGSALIFQGKGLAPELFISYIILFVLVIAPVKDLSTAFSQIKKGQACSERIVDFLSQQEAGDVQVRQEALKNFQGLTTGIDLRNVTFSYGEHSDVVLKNVCLTIPKGKKIALTGSSGGGKSTLMDLLMRYYEPQQGEILVDGDPLSHYDVASWRKRLGAVAQDTVLFNDTVFRNIAFGSPAATLQQVQEAARIANAHDFIMQLPRGYDTNIGDGGSMLSGGQRQRLSIARAILRNPDLLMLDEATSALDTESEYQVQQALRQALQGRTALIIAHRLSTIVSCDEIVVLEKGEIVERGTHSDLLALGGRYKQLWDTSTRLVNNEDTTTAGKGGSR